MTKEAGKETNRLTDTEGAHTKNIEKLVDGDGQRTAGGAQICDQLYITISRLCLPTERAFERRFCIES